VCIYIYIYIRGDLYSNYTYMNLDMGVCMCNNHMYVYNVCMFRYFLIYTIVCVCV